MPKKKPIEERRLKILFADDQIPDEAIPYEDIESWIKEVYAKPHSISINPFREMRKAVELLRDSGYDVRIARTFTDAVALVKKDRFDIAIVDLGWYYDKSVPVSQRSFKGWEVCEAIDAADSQKQSKTPQVIFSSRFKENPTISMQAADRGKLPIYKGYVDATNQALRAAVKFIESIIKAPSRVETLILDTAEELKTVRAEMLEQPLKHYARWFTVTLILVALAVLVLITGGALTLFKVIETEVGIATSIASFLISAITALLFKQLDKARKDVKSCRVDTITECKAAFERAIAQSG